MRSQDFKIWASHGIVRNLKSTHFLHRNLLDFDAVSEFLSKLGTKFVSLEAALAGEGSALTIDDSTFAAADLARLAIEHGHKATLFVSGRNTADKLPYIFHNLNAILDSIEIAHVFIGEKALDIDNYEVKSMIRRLLKSRFSPLRTYEEQAAVITDFAFQAGVTEIVLPDYLGPLSSSDLKELVDLGVNIENHGWDHVDMSGWSPTDVTEQIEKGQRYLQGSIGVNTSHFAVPFGEVTPTVDSWIGPGVWFLASGHANPGWVSNGLYNRPTLKIR